MKELGYGQPRNRWNLWRFIRGMKKGDIVVVPSSYEFNVCEILDDEILTNESIDSSLLVDWNGNIAKKDENGYLVNSVGNQVDMGFYRRVKLTECHISRFDYAEQDLSSRMKIRQTNANISDLAQTIETAVHNFRSKKPINLKEQILENVTDIVLKKIKESLDSEKFEKLVKWYLKSLGANKVETPAKNESSTDCGDADQVAYFDKLQLVIMVQAKKHEDITDKWAVEQVNAYKTNHHYDSSQTQMWVISTCDDYNSSAKKQAEEYGVRLINGREFTRMIIEAGLEDLPL